jgi:tetratricopeptide (TPR) repeat protein
MTTEQTTSTLKELGPISDDPTMAELLGMTPDLGEAIARLAEDELEAGRLAQARTILEGLVVTNHRDADAWALLSVTHRRLGQPLAARFCAEVASRLAPGDPWVRLTRAESLLGMPGPITEARTELAALAPDGLVGTRARSLLAALGQ